MPEEEQADDHHLLVHNEADPVISPEAEKIFSEYSKVPASDQIAHVRSVVRLAMPLTSHFANRH
jgi:hypothetical protein